MSNIRGLKRKYEEKAKTTLSISSFYDRFTPEMVDFLRKCVLHAIEFQAQQTGRVLDDKLKRFKGLVIQDSTIIRLHESLAKIRPATRTKKIVAGVKVSCIVSAVADSPKSVRIYQERTSEAKIELLFKELKSHYRMDQIPSANPNIVKCLIWIAILTLRCSCRILRLTRNANPENANRYTHLRWAKVFAGQADLLLTEVLECMGLKLDMLTLYNLYLGQ